MDNESGFYKYSDEFLHFGPNYVYAPTFTLVKEDKDTYSLPIDGWYWFESEAEAKAFFELI